MLGSKYQSIRNPTRRIHSGLWRIYKTTSTLIFATFLVACQNKVVNIIENTAQPVKEQQNQAQPDQSEHLQSGLSSDLLNDILVASIARQRNDPQTSLEYLSRAAYQSRDERLISTTINLATNMQDFETVLQMAELLQSINPDSQGASLSIARARFGLGEDKAAFDILIRQASDQIGHKTAILQSIASLLANQNSITILSDFIAAAENATLNEYTAMTAALLASNLKQDNQYNQLLNKTLSLKPDWEFAAILKIAELAKTDISSVVEFAKSFLANYPSYTQFRLQYSRLLIQQGKIEQAIIQLNLIIEKNPDATDALYTSGVIYLDQGKLDQAKTALERHLKLNPNNDQARIYLSDAETELGNLSAAAKLLYGVSSQYHYLDAQVKLARIISERNNIDSAIKHLQQIQVYSADDKARLILEQDSLYRENELLDRSILVLDEGLELYPNHPDLLYNRGLLAAQLDLLNIHEQDMRKLISLQPNNAHAYNALGYTLADQTDRLDEALDLISRANELLPNNAFILDSLGWVHFRLGNNKQAITFLRSAIEFRQDAEIAAHLGEVLWITGNRDEALEIWQLGSQWAPENRVLKQTIERLTTDQKAQNQRSHQFQFMLSTAANNIILSVI